MATPTDEDLSAFTGQQVNEDQATAVIAVVTSMARSYTRGQGFTAGEANSDIGAVVLSASARLIADTSQNLQSRQMGPFQISYRDGFTGWTTAELAVLNRYRERAR